MAKIGKFSSTDLKKLQRELNGIKPDKITLFCEDCAKELAARLLAKVIKRTPVGDYSREKTVVAKRDSKNHKKGDRYTVRVNPSGKKGGTLRRGWTAETFEDAASGSGASTPAQEYAKSLQIQHEGNIFRVEIVNPVEYSSYVEFGHRTRGGKGWVEGKFMLTLSEQELQEIAPAVLEARIAKLLKGAVQ